MSRSDQRRLLLDCILEKLMRGCESTPAALVTRESLAPAEGPLPEGLERFLNEYIAHPKRRPGIGAVMSATMADFGSRVFRHLLSVGTNRKSCDTDLNQNRHDVLAAANLLLMLAGECHHTAFLPRETGELLSRVANALHDDWGRPRGATAGRQCEGRLAAVLEILVRGGVKPAAAGRWLEAEMRRAGLLDEAGNQIPARRVASWRNNFNKGIGAQHARYFFGEELADHAALLTAPNKVAANGADDRKREICRAEATRLVRMLAHLFNRTVAAPLKT
jgi:hypothetical protein